MVCKLLHAAFVIALNSCEDKKPKRKCKKLKKRGKYTCRGARWCQDFEQVKNMTTFLKNSNYESISTQSNKPSNIENDDIKPSSSNSLASDKRSLDDTTTNLISDNLNHKMLTLTTQIFIITDPITPESQFCFCTICIADEILLFGLALLICR